jgi:hypothetical protein
MRLLKYFIPVLAVLITSAVYNDAEATPVREVDKAGIYQPIVNAITNDQMSNDDRIHEEQLESDRADSEQRNNETAVQTGQLARHDDANNVNRAALSQQESMVDTFKRTNELDAYACSFASGARIGRAAAAASQATTMQLEERLAIIAGESGPTVNGLVDFQNQLYDRMESLGSARFSLGNLLHTKTIPQSGAIADQLNYTQDLLYARVPVYLNQDLKDNADTEVKNLSIQADRLRSEMAIGQTVFSTLQGIRAPAGGANVQWIREIMEENEFPPEYVSELLPGDASLRAQMEALAVGQFGHKYMIEKFVASPEAIPIGILYNSMLTNLILFKQYELLESIAAATATNVIAVREEAIKDVNARISRKNAAQ